MDAYERNVRALVKAIDTFFETRGMSAGDMDKRVAWIRSYHEKIDRERTDKAEQLQKKLRL